jgi:hypothetical protein
MAEPLAYSKQKFELCGVNSDAARKLADDLQNDVNEEIHTAVLTVFLNVIEKLNVLRHNLTPYDEISPGDISFRNEPTEKECYLRLASDAIISRSKQSAPPARAIDPYFQRRSYPASGGSSYHRDWHLHRLC